MRNTLSLKLSVIAVSIAILTACGGGGGSSTDQTADFSYNNPSAKTFADCLKLTPGVKFLKSNGYTNLVVQEQFEGQSQLGIAELRADGTRFGVNYYSLGATYFQFLGNLRYAMNGTDINSKTVYSGNTIPANMTPGQTSTLTYTETYTSYTMPSNSSTSTDTDQITFVGFEDITLGGRTFSNVCKIKEPVQSSSTGEIYMTWLAKDFGVIRTERQTAQGVTVDGTRIELQTIINAPAS